MDRPLLVVGLSSLLTFTSACRPSRPDESASESAAVAVPAARTHSPETPDPPAKPAEPDALAAKASVSARPGLSLTDLLTRTHLFGVALTLDESRGPDGAAAVAKCRARKFPKKLTASEELGSIAVGRPLTLIHETGAFSAPIASVECHKADDFNADRAVVRVDLRELPEPVRRDFSPGSRLQERLVVLGVPPVGGAALSVPAKIPANDLPPVAARWRPKPDCGTPIQGRDAWWLDDAHVHAYVVTRQACSGEDWFIGALFAATSDKPALVVGEEDTVLNRPKWLVDLDGDGTKEVVLNRVVPGFNEHDLVYREGDAWKLHKLEAATYD